MSLEVCVQRLIVIVHLVLLRCCGRVAGKVRCGCVYDSIIVVV